MLQEGGLTCSRLQGSLAGMLLRYKELHASVILPTDLSDSKKLKVEPKPPGRSQPTPSQVTTYPSTVKSTIWSLWPAEDSLLREDNE